MTGIASVSGGLLAVLKVPKALGEGAKQIAEARKTWIEGTLLKNQLESQSETDAELPERHQRRVASSFKSMEQVKDLVMDDPTVMVAVPHTPDEK